MNTISTDSIRHEFGLLPAEEQVAIIQEGAALRLGALKKRQFLAESKMHHLQEKYQTSLAALDAKGLPDDADYEVHEDYIIWHHWKEVYESVTAQIARLEPFVRRRST